MDSAQVKTRAMALVLTWALSIELPGTQPVELTLPLRRPSVCAPGNHAGNAAHDVWKVLMMANALRDPLFHAALAVAEQDAPGSGDLCLRCHTPPGWLAGRSDPSDGSALVESDFDGVQCDFCHRLSDRDGTPFIGNA